MLGVGAGVVIILETGLLEDTIVTTHLWCRIPRRSRLPPDSKTPAQKQSELLGRLRRLESVVTELAAQVEDENGAKVMMGQRTVDASGTDSSWATSSVQLTDSAEEQEVEENEDFGRLVVDKDGGLHVGNRFWTVFCSEVDNILQAVHDVADYSDDSIMTEPSTNGEPAPLSHLGFVFGSAEFAKALDGLNPMPSQMLFIWQAYVENVDPFIKILHIPTVEKIIKELKGNFSSCGTATKALLFAISLAAITSMDEETVSFNFNTPKGQLLQRYQFGTEQALARANFLSTKDITVVQALVIYLSLLPNIGAQDKVFPLTGLVLRLAKGAGLHREGDENQYNQLQRETRRRLWWQICFIDSASRRPDASDLSISPASFSTGLPTNSNDIDLDGSTAQIPNPDQGSTGVTLCLIRCELWYLTQAIRADKTSSIETRLGLFNALKEKVEKTYFQHLQQDLAWDSFIRTMAKLFFAKVELVIRRQSRDQEPTDELLRPSIEVIRCVQLLKSEPSWVKWRWQLQGQMPWHAMGVFLRQVSHHSWTHELEDAWAATNALKDTATKDIRTGYLWKSLMELYAEAERHREKELKRQGDKAQHTLQRGDRVNSDVQQMLDNAGKESSEIPVNHPLIDTSTFDSSLHISPPADNGALSVERLSTALGTASDDLPSWEQSGGGMDLGQGDSFGKINMNGDGDGVDWEALMDLDETWNWDFL
ncbi:uncharacterized protein FIESC28_05240 [Fusarium coffeatum]|uniref:Xylanolytic transcriptional activator regulatory domain-containing protein n=1 Tax=Fusarium coffeatum TaxID=231269 RepID=A0A366RUF8_9HYPO|nr:uncharacterized protein FIESC28_05240 [Fusarium coffeatum]RBR20723.1 hypothetical protein FIESC28_05240 [Fusarium coffeatum]